MAAHECEFTHTPRPDELMVTQANGKKWRLRVSLTVFAVNDLGEMTEAGIPKFQIRSGIAVDATPAEDGEDRGRPG